MDFIFASEPHILNFTHLILKVINGEKLFWTVSNSRRFSSFVDFVQSRFMLLLNNPARYTRLIYTNYCRFLSP